MNTRVDIKEYEKLYAEDCIRSATSNNYCLTFNCFFFFDKTFNGKFISFRLKIYARMYIYNKGTF